MYGFKIRSLGPGTPLTECPVLAEADWGDIGTPPVTPADSHAPMQMPETAKMRRPVGWGS